MKRKVKIKNKKGLKLAAIIESSDFESEHPVVILLHGFKGYKDEATYTDLAKRLLETGMASIRFDTSGFGDSEGTIEKDYRLSNYVDDAQSVYEYLLEQGWVDKNKIACFGQSMGGLQAIILSSNNSEIKAMVSVSPPDLFATRDDFGKVIDEWKEKGYLELESSLMGKIKVPYEYAVDARKYDAIEIAKEVSIPKLFVLGLEDTTVIPDQTRDVYKVAKKPKELIEIEGMDHFYKKQPEILKKVNKIVVEFFKKNLEVDK